MAQQLTRSGHRTHTLLPPEVSGYAFDAEHSWWSTIVAEESSNLIINPSFERLAADGTYDEYASSGTFNELGEDAIPSLYPPVGATAGRRCALLVAAPGIGNLTYTEGVAVTPGPYTFSLDVYVPRVPMLLVTSVLTTGDVIVATTTHRIVSSGWQRIHMTYRETATATRRLRITHNNVGTHGLLLYTDAWQFERKAYPTTYLDGDMIGFDDTIPFSSYFWYGTPHASISMRRASTGSGGRLVYWSDEARFMTTSVVGLYQAPFEQRLQTLGNGKQIHLGMDEVARDFTITGTVFGLHYADLKNKRNALQRLLEPHNTSTRDQVVLRHQPIDADGMPVSNPVEIVCVYQDGLQGNITNLYQESIAVQFHAVQPFPVDVFQHSVGLTLAKELVANMIAYRDEYGELHNLGTGTTTGGVVARAGFLRDGTQVAFGNFTQIAGDTASNGARWDGTDWIEIADSPSGVVDIDDGFVLNWPLTVASGSKVYEYDEITDNWTELGDGFSGQVNAIMRDENGDVWVAGDFDFLDDDVTVMNNVARWNYATQAWESLGTGVTDPGDLYPNPLEATAVLAPNDGFVYFAGTFWQGDTVGVSTTGITVIKWDIVNEVFVGMGTGLNAAPNQLIQGRDGYIYATGPFDQDGAETYDIRGFARWNGYSWEEAFPLVRPGDVHGADGVIQDADGIFWFYNQVLDTDTDLFTIEGLGEVAWFGWRNGVFYPPYMVDAALRHLSLGPGGRAIHVTDAYTGAGTPAKVPAFTTIEYDGTADAPVLINFQGPGKFNQLRNYSVESGLYGSDKFIFSEFELAFMRNDTQKLLVYSNQRRNLQGKLLGGAGNLSSFRLIPGTNRIGLLITETDEDASEAWLIWKNRYMGIGENPS